jgi:hypothetical protein
VSDEAQQSISNDEHNDSTWVHICLVFFLSFSLLCFSVFLSSSFYVV